MSTPITRSFAPTTVIVSRVQRFYNYPSKIFPVSCTNTIVHDTYFDDDLDDVGNPIYNFYETIAGSRVYVSKVLKGNAGVVVNLSRIRPKGIEGSNGMVSAGVANFLQAYSVCNLEIRRGSAFRNGAVVLQLDAHHPDLEDFLNAPASLIPWCKRGVTVEPGWMDEPYYPLVEKALAEGKIFLYKQQYDQTGSKLEINVCLTGDTYIHTTNGLQTIKSLVGSQFSVMKDGEVRHSKPAPISLYRQGQIDEMPPGFFSTGLNPVYELKTKEGYSIKGTANHNFVLDNGELVTMHQLNPGDKIKINSSSSPDTSWGESNEEMKGWLVGQFYGNGSFSGSSARLIFYKDWSFEEVQQVFESLQHLFPRGVTGCLPKVVERENGFIHLHSSAFGRYLREELGMSDGHKKITDEILASSSSFIKGFLGGYFDADGHITKLAIPRTTAETIQICSARKDDLKKIQLLLASLNIRSLICEDNHKAAQREFPKDPGVLRNCQSADRLDISGRVQVERFMNLVRTQKVDKVDTFDLNREVYQKSAYKSHDFATVKSVTYCGEEETFNCTIDHDDHLYMANGLVTKNCQGILFKPRSTCTLAHVNLGLVRNHRELIVALVNGAKDIDQIWEDFYSAWSGGLGEGMRRSASHFIDPSTDKQVGLGLVGLGNMLVNFGVKYSDFATALYALTESDADVAEYMNIHYPLDPMVSTEAIDLAKAFIEGYYQAATFFHGKGYERGFCVEPTATCAYKQRDYNGYVTSPEISPPIAHPETKIARRVVEDGFQDYQYPPGIELAGHDVSWEDYDTLCLGFQRLMNNTGLAHAISYNWWMSKPVNKQTLGEWNEGELISVYYRWQELSSEGDKTNIGMEVDKEGEEFWSVSDEDDNLEEQAVICQLNSTSCTSCGE